MVAVTVRPMEAADVEGVRLVSQLAFADLEESSGVPEAPAPPPERARIRVAHPLATDPGGCWVGEHEGRIVGASIALMREGLWGLSLLVVDPAHQSAGMGRELLARAFAYGQDARGWLILSSPDSRAVAAYLGLGLELEPAAAASGVPRKVRRPDAVRPAQPGDVAMMAEVGRAVRGAAHGQDIDKLAAAGHRVLVHPGRGFATTGRNGVSLLAAHDEEAAAELLRAALADSGDKVIRVEWLSARQQWAVRECRSAGLTFHLAWGAVLSRGEVGPFTPYLPSGAYL